MQNRIFYFYAFIFVGKWLPDEEQRLAAAVYDLTGCKPGTISEGLDGGREPSSSFQLIL